MSLEKRILNKQNDRLKTNLAQQKVELNLIADVEKALDKANSKRRNLEKLAKKISSDLNELQSDYAIAFQIAKKGENAAKEIGAEDLRKLFGNRADEAKDYEGAVGRAANKIFSAVSGI